VPYRIVFLIEDNAPAGRAVTILHVRHGAARPIGRTMAREIE
jgi:hypothetical protein